MDQNTKKRDEFGLQPPQLSAEVIQEMRQKLRALLDWKEQQKQTADAEKQQAVEPSSLSATGTTDVRPLPTAAEIAQRRSVSVEEASKQQEDAQPEEQLVETNSGEVIFVQDPERNLHLFVRVKTPEIQEITDNKETFQVLTGRYNYHWRQRRPEDGDALEVLGLPKLKKPSDGDRSVPKSTFAEWRADVYARGADSSTHLRGKFEPYRPLTWFQRQTGFTGWAK